ncbi:hypothetical protein GOV10_01340 [Candidatus Woesearchaeota archaeon]|nr:hypothetical protein [Candidatus Woesearchaeota archaeon]
MDELDLQDEKDLNKLRSGAKKPKMSLLNQKNVSKWDMDELFSEEEEYMEEF